VLEFLYLDHFGESFDALDEGIFDRLSQPAREGHELRRIELLLAEKNDLVLEKRLADFRSGEILRKIDAEDLGAERPRDAAYFYCSTLMFWLLMIEP
jgi:hypothetical protein